MLGEVKTKLRRSGAREIAQEAWTELLVYLQEAYDDVTETTESYPQQIEWGVMFGLPEGVHDDEVKADRRLDELLKECASILHMATGFPQLNNVDNYGVRVDDSLVLRLYADYDDGGTVMLDMSIDRIRNPITEAVDLSSKDVETIFAEAFDEVVAYLKDNYEGVVSSVYDDGAKRASFDPPVDVTGATNLRFSPGSYDATMEITKEIENVLSLVTGFPKLSGGTSVFDGVRLDDFVILTLHVMLSKHGYFKCTFELVRSDNRVKKSRRKRTVESTERTEATIMEEAWAELEQYANETFENVKFFDNADYSMLAFDTPKLEAGKNYSDRLAELQHDLTQIVHLATGLKIDKTIKPSAISMGPKWWYLRLDQNSVLVCSVRYMAGKQHAFQRIRVELFPRNTLSGWDIKEVLDGFGNKSAGKDGVAGNLRNGVPTTGHTGGNVLTDEENEENKLKRAACVLIVAEDGKVLAVSRKDNPNAWGLPGGKVDPGETEEQAAGRELQEETGLTAKKLSQVFSADDGEYMTTTFACEAEGEIDTTESGVIRWVEPAILLDPTTSPFSGYNKALFQRLGRIR